MALSASTHYAHVFSLSSSVSAAWLRHDSVTLLRSIRDVDDNANRQLLEFHGLSTSIESSTKQMNLKPLSCVELSSYLLMDVSPSGTHTITITTNKEDKISLAYTSLEGRSFKIDLTSMHGKVVGDTWLGGCSWSSDERYFTYVAREKEPIVKSSFDKDSSDSTNIFDYKEDWGEKYDGVGKLCLCVLDIVTNVVVLVPGIDSSKYTVGQPTFSPISSSLILAYTAWPTSPRKLGMIYCYQRPSFIFTVDLTKLVQFTEPPTPSNQASQVTHINQTPHVYVSRSPRFSPDGSSLLFIGSINKVASHNSCFQLLRTSISSTLMPTTVSIVVDKVTSPKEYPRDFPGLFCDQLPRNCFLNSNEIVLTSMWGSSESVLVIQLDSGNVLRLNPQLLNEHTSRTSTSKSIDEWNNNAHSSCSILDVHNGCIAFITSSPISPQRFGIHDFKKSQDSPTSVFRSFPPCAITKNVNVHQITPMNLLSSMRWKMFPFKDKKGIPFDALFITPKPVDEITKPLPLLVIVHGGPHSVSPSTFLPAYAYLSTFLQANIMHVNYRGSTGFGLDCINSLPGNIGTQDVNDVIDCIQFAQTLTCSLSSNIQLVDANKMCIIGGSHGGFLSTHLIGQYPDMFKTAIIRNPVTNIPAMFSISDIPDWCHVEVTGESSYDFTTFQVPTPNDLQLAYSKSPIRYIDAVKTPILLCLGGKDRRVPPSQGLEYHHALTSRGVSSRLLYFPEDGHALDKPSTEFEQWICAAELMKRLLA